MPKKKKEFYYHVTTEDWGNAIILKPISSKNPKLSRGPDEPNISRICVGPDIAHCLSSIYWYICKGKHMNVYKTSVRKSVTQPWGVKDASVTKEKWLLKPTTFRLAGHIPKSVLEKLPIQCPLGSNKAFHQKQLKTIAKILSDNNIEVKP